MNLSGVFRKIKKGDAVSVLIIGTIGFLSISWFRGNNLISAGDMGLPLDRTRYLRLMFYVWDETIATGVFSPRQLASLIPYALWGGLSELLGLSLVFWEKTLFFIWFAGSGFSMYYLCSVLGMKRLGRFSAPVFYMMNPFSLFIIWRVGHGLIQMPYAFAPLLLGLYIKGLKEKRGTKYIVGFSFLWLLVTTAAYANPRSMVIHWIPLLAYFIYFLFLEKSRRERLFALLFTGKLGIFWMFLNALWLLPLIFSFSETIASSHLPVLLGDAETQKLTSVKISDALRMFGYWSQHGGYKGEPYYSYSDYYRSPIIALISFLIPLLVFLPLLSKRGKGGDNGKFKILFFAVLALVGIFFIKGFYPPFGSFTIFIYERTPYLILLARFAFLFFGSFAYLAFGVLFGYGVLDFYEFGTKIIGKLALILVGVAFFLLFGVLVFPFWTGDVIRPDGQVWPGERVKIPDYYWQFKEWLKNQEGDFRIFPLPMSRTYNVANKWEKGYSGGDPMRWFSNRPVINANIGETFKIPELIGQEIEDPSHLKGTEKLLGLIGAKYLIVRNDTNWEFIRSHSWWFNHNRENLEKFFNAQEGLALERQFGKLDIYKVGEQNLNPQIFIPDKITFVEGSVGALQDMTAFDDFGVKGRGVFFSVAEEGNVPNFLREVEEVFVEPSVSVDEGKNVAGYSFRIPREGSYEIFLRKGNFEKYFSSPEELPIQLDGKFEMRKLKDEGNGLLSLGSIEAEAGDHVLEISPPKAFNLIEDFSFENGIWSGVEDASPWLERAPRISAELVNNSSEGKKALKLRTKSHTAAVFQPFKFTKGEGIYKLSFDFKHERGGASRFLIWQNDGELNRPRWVGEPNPLGTTAVQTRFSYNETLEICTDWLSYEVAFELGEYTEAAGLAFLCDSVGDGRETINLFDNVKVEKIFDNPLLLRLEVRDEMWEKNKPKVEFTRVNPTKYKVRVSGVVEPYFLVFSESFHPEWKAYISKNQRSKIKNQKYDKDIFIDRNMFETWGVAPIPEEKHAMVNGFANSWYVEEPGDYEIILEFWPQRIFILSLGLSSLVLVGGLFYILKHGF